MPRAVRDVTRGEDFKSTINDSVMCVKCLCGSACVERNPSMCVVQKWEHNCHLILPSHPCVAVSDDDEDAATRTLMTRRKTADYRVHVLTWAVGHFNRRRSVLCSFAFIVNNAGRRIAKNCAGSVLVLECIRLQRALPLPKMEWTWRASLFQWLFKQLRLCVQHMLLCATCFCVA